jgi:hypothetical protein
MTCFTRLIILSIAILLISCQESVDMRKVGGTWTSRQEMAVRYNTGFIKFRFVKAVVPIVVNIHGDGVIDGTVGTAQLKECAIESNRGWLGRMLNMQTDYIFKGKLIGTAFDGDTLLEKTISAPFNIVKDTLKGGFFQLEGSGSFPMITLRLIKQPSN